MQRFTRFEYTITTPSTNFPCVFSCHSQLRAANVPSRSSGQNKLTLWVQNQNQILWRWGFPKCSPQILEQTCIYQVETTIVFLYNERRTLDLPNIKIWETLTKDFLFKKHFLCFTILHFYAFLYIESLNTVSPKMAQSNKYWDDYIYICWLFFIRTCYSS